jgi:hypothetical protein
MLSYEDDSTEPMSEAGTEPEHVPEYFPDVNGDE